METTFKRLLPLLLLLTLPAAVQAQDFTYTTNNGAITITGYTGPAGAVAIPSTIFDLPVTSVVSHKRLELFSLCFSHSGAGAAGFYPL
jgi:hypothetical protein